MTTSPAPEWKLVPVELTLDMLDAGAAPGNGNAGAAAEDCWHAMLRAAPPAPSGVRGDELALTMVDNIISYCEAGGPSGGHVRVSRYSLSKLRNAIEALASRPAPQVQDDPRRPDSIKRYPLERIERYEKDMLEKHGRDWRVLIGYDGFSTTIFEDRPAPQAQVSEETIGAAAKVLLANTSGIDADDAYEIARKMLEPQAAEGGTIPSDDDLIAVPRSVLAAANYIIRNSDRAESTTAYTMRRLALSSALAAPARRVGREEIWEILYEARVRHLPIDEPVDRILALISGEREG